MQFKLKEQGKRLITPETAREIFESLYATSSLWLSKICRTDSKESKTWPLPDGEVSALCFRTPEFPKGGLSILKSEDGNDYIYRVGLNVYAQNPRVPDGSFAVLLSNQGTFGFIGGVIELFPAIRTDADIELFRREMMAVAQKYRQDYEACRRGLAGAFRLKGSDENLGAEAGFNFYRSDLEADAGNIDFAKQAFLGALEAYGRIVEKNGIDYGAEDSSQKKVCWQKHLRFMQEEDAGIKMALDQGIPLEFFEFSAFPPVIGY